MKKRLIILISICVLSLFFVTLFACGKQMFNVKYIAEEGGIVYGEINQSVESGKNCTQVGTHISFYGFIIIIAGKLVPLFP